MKPRFKLGERILVHVRRKDGMFVQVPLEVTHFTESGKLFLKDRKGGLRVIAEEKVLRNIDGPASNHTDWISEEEGK